MRKLTKKEARTIDNLTEEELIRVITYTKRPEVREYAFSISSYDNLFDNIKYSEIPTVNVKSWEIIKTRMSSEDLVNVIINTPIYTVAKEAYRMIIHDIEMEEIIAIISYSKHIDISESLWKEKRKRFNRKQLVEISSYSKSHYVSREALRDISTPSKDDLESIIINSISDEVKNEAFDKAKDLFSNKELIYYTKYGENDIAEKAWQLVKKVVTKNELKEICFYGKTCWVRGEACSMSEGRDFVSSLI